MDGAGRAAHCELHGKLLRFFRAAALGAGGCRIAFTKTSRLVMESEKLEVLDGICRCLLGRLQQ